MRANWIAVQAEAPRLLLVSPSLEFHPTTETVMSFLAPQIEVERVGLAVGHRGAVLRRERLGGMLNYYYRATA